MQRYGCLLLDTPCQNNILPQYGSLKTEALSALPTDRQGELNTIGIDSPLHTAVLPVPIPPLHNHARRSTEFMLTGQWGGGVRGRGRGEGGLGLGLGLISCISCMKCMKCISCISCSGGGGKAPPPTTLMLCLPPAPPDGGHDPGHRTPERGGAGLKVLAPCIH